MGTTKSSARSELKFGESVKVADSVTAAPALSYWSHSSNAVAPGTGEIELCASATPLAADTATRNDIFSARIVELKALRCPTATGIPDTARSKSRYNALRIRCALIGELMFAFTLLALRCVNSFYSKQVKAVETIQSV